MTVIQNGTSVVASAAASASMSEAGTFPTGSSPLIYHLIVCFVTVYGTTGATLGSTPAGYTLVTSVTAGSNTITALYTKTSTGADAAPTFTATTTGTAADSALNVTIYDLSDSQGGTPLVDQTGTLTGTTGTIVPVTSSGLSGQAGILCIAATICSQGTTTNTTTWTTPGQWIAGGNTTATNFSQTYSAWSQAVPWANPSATASTTLTHGRTSSEQSAIMAAFKPPALIGGQPYPLGAGDSAASATTETITVWNNTRKGDAIVVAISVSATNAPVSVTDSKSNTYVQEALNSTGTGFQGAIYVALNSATALVSGTDTITATWTTANTDVKWVNAIGVPNCVAVDVTAATGHAASTAPTLTTGAVNFANEIAVGSITCTSAASIQIVWTSPSIPMTPQAWEGSGGASMQTMAIQEVGAPTTVTMAGTITSAIWDVEIVTLKIVVPPPIGLPDTDVAYGGNIIGIGQAVATASLW